MGGGNPLVLGVKRGTWLCFAVSMRFPCEEVGVAAEVRPNSRVSKNLEGWEGFLCIPTMSRKALSVAMLVRELGLRSVLCRRWPRVYPEYHQGCLYDAANGFGWLGYRDCHRCEGHYLTFQHLRMHL